MASRTPDPIDWPPPPRGRRSRGRFLLLVAFAAVLVGGGSAVSYYVDALWFESLGYGSVFWRMLNLRTVVFSIFAALTLGALYGSFLLLMPADFGTGGVIFVNGRPVALPVGRVLRTIALLAS